MKILVTGAAGFIGSHLTSRLAALGHEVRAADNLSTGRRQNLEAIRGPYEFLEADLSQPEACARAVRGVEVVLHQAAIPAVPRSLADPVGTHRANVDATLQLLEASRGAGVRRLVYAASSSAYGDTVTLPKREEMPTSPRSPYAVQKLVGELYGRVYSESLGLAVVSLRYFNVYGPRQDPASPYSAVIPKFITRMLRGERPIVFGDGNTSRDFTYIDDVVQANVLAMDAPEAPGHTMNVGAGQRTSLLQLVARLNAILGTRLEPIHEPERTGDVRHSLADISLARRLLGYEPKVALDEGLARTVASLWPEAPAA